ncbi:MAG TPA: hypothetical protein VJV79_06310 [Polyangiaceae bacterium]|nr:hypothetical protein [Polyangiaceae bacterium]
MTIETERERRLRDKCRWFTGSEQFVAQQRWYRISPQQVRASARSSGLRFTLSIRKLLARIDKDEIGLAKPEYRVHIIEALRRSGFNAVGAENLVFGKDDSDEADFVLGGTVTELDCFDLGRAFPAQTKPTQALVVDTPDTPLSLQPEVEQQRLLDADYERRLKLFNADYERRVKEQSPRRVPDGTRLLPEPDRQGAGV